MRVERTLHIQDGQILAVASRFKSSTRFKLFALPSKVDVSSPGKGNSNFHGSRLVHQIVSMMKWTRSSRLSIQNSLPFLCAWKRTEEDSEVRNSHGDYRGTSLIGNSHPHRITMGPYA